MPAGLPGATSVQNLANPSLGNAVILSPFSGPKGSPKDNDVEYVPGTFPVVFGTTTKQANGEASTGGLSTGIGYGPACKTPGVKTSTLGVTLASAQVGQSGFDDDETPGTVMPDGTAAADARLLAIGGGKSTANTVASPSVAAPYAVQPILGAGNGGSRDAGAGPAFTGFAMKMVTATGAIANGAVLETGFVNRTGATVASGDSAFGSSTTASAAVT